MQNRRYDLRVGKDRFVDGTHVMAIINVTPDSFYSASRVGDKAVETAKRFVAQGAKILDIGGQSTRPGAQRVSALEEMSRVLPAVEAIRAELPEVSISVDTYFPEVAQACIASGADMINDVSCLAYDDMPRVIEEGGASVCVMHDRRNSKIADLFLDKQLGLVKAVEKLHLVGIPDNRILLDGGIGFNKNNNEDWALLDGYDRLMDAFDLPFLLGTSRKSMFGGEVSTRLSATLESTVKAVKMGVLFVRVHDVAENKAVIDCYKKGV